MGLHHAIQVDDRAPMREFGYVRHTLENETERASEMIALVDQVQVVNDLIDRLMLRPCSDMLRLRITQLQAEAHVLAQQADYFSRHF